MLRLVCIALVSSMALAQMQPMPIGQQPMGQPMGQPMAPQPMGQPMGFGNQNSQQFQPLETTSSRPIFKRQVTTDDDTTAGSTTRGFGGFGSVTRKVRSNGDSSEEITSSTAGRLITRSAGNDDSSTTTTRRGPLVTRQAAGGQQTNPPNRFGSQTSRPNLGGATNRPVTRSAQAGGVVGDQSGERVTSRFGSSTPSATFQRFTGNRQ